MTERREKVFGRNAVAEVLRAERREVFELKVAHGGKDNPRLDEIVRMAESRELPVRYVDRQDLDGETSHHQGLSAVVSAYPYVDVYDLLERTASKDEPAFYLVLDQIQDPRNFGALLRTADAAGVHGVIVPEHRSAQVTSVVVAASAGASEYQFIARSNIVKAIERLKAEGIWIIGLENSEKARWLGDIDASGAVGLVLGHEGRGLRRLVREKCDFLARIPMHGHIDSLNVSVAGSLAMYHVLSYR